MQKAQWVRIDKNIDRYWSSLWFQYQDKQQERICFSLLSPSASFFSGILDPCPIDQFQLCARAASAQCSSLDECGLDGASFHVVSSDWSQDTRSFQARVDYVGFRTFVVTMSPDDFQCKMYLSHFKMKLKMWFETRITHIITSYVWASKSTKMVLVAKWWMLPFPRTVYLFLLYTRTYMYVAWHLSETACRCFVIAVVPCPMTSLFPLLVTTYIGEDEAMTVKLNVINTRL